MLNNRRIRVRAALALVVVTLYLLWSIADLGNTIDTGPIFDQPSPQKELQCKSLPGADNVLIIFRTGSTELEDRFAVHFSTSLQCFPNYLVFSDLEEDYGEEHILDALEQVSPEIIESHPDFELYRRLRKQGRSSLDPSELAGSPDKFAVLTGKTQNKGWKLDKWKFLPMVNQTLHERPGMEWYVFVEADTFIFWSMLQQYLSLLDPTKPIYTGNQMFIGSDLFAHGGSGFVVSEPALQLVVDHYAANKAEIEKATNAHWAGDCVLGKAFTDSGVPFTNAWPAFQGDYPGLVPYAKADGRSVPDESLREWCHPTIFYHHMSPAMVQDLWHFEQDWIDQHNSVGTSHTRIIDQPTNSPQSIETLRHGDIFSSFVMPQMMHPREGWENLSDKEEGKMVTVDDCRSRCLAQPDCRQYSLDQELVCRTRVDPRLGKAAKGFSSGWIEDRIVDFERGMAPCGSESWPV